jgi:hypothetical protein
MTLHPEASTEAGEAYRAGERAGYAQAIRDYGERGRDFEARLLARTLLQTALAEGDWRLVQRAVVALGGVPLEVPRQRDEPTGLEYRAG